MMFEAVSSDQVRPEIVDIFAEVFEHEIPINTTTSPGDVARWDSLNHVALISMIERIFGIGLSMDEMIEIQSVGDIQRLLARHGV